MPPIVSTRVRPRNAPGRQSAPDLAPGHVQIYCADPARSLVALLGPDPIKLTGGGAGWDTVARPRQTSMTLWGGIDPFGVQLPLMLDDLAGGGHGVEQAVRLLNLLTRGDDDAEPGVVEVGGVPLPADEWVIGGLDWGDPIRHPDDLRLIRQPVTVALIEYVPPELVQTRRRSLVKPRRRTRTVVVKRGDTPAKIARRVRCKWTDLRELNPGIVTKANQTAATKGAFRVGGKLRAPAATSSSKAKGKAGHGRAGKTTTSATKGHD